MDITNSANFLASSILMMLGTIVIIIGAVVINNILHKYWKPVRMFTVDSFTMFGGNENGHSKVFVTQEELQRITPILEEMQTEKNKPKDGKK
jgi:hypothetical protein